MTDPSRTSSTAPDTSRSRAGRIGYGLGGLFFVYAMVVQFNDVDSPVWIAIYLGAALLAFAAAFDLPRAVERALVVAAGILAAVALVWGAMLLPEALEVPSFAESEVAREVGGLGIVGAFSLVLFALRARGMRRA